MSMWNLFARKVEVEVEAGECAPPVSTFEKADHNSIRPFEAECIVGIKTYRGVEHKFQKPDGRYHLANPDIIARNRARQVAKFDELTQLLEQNISPHSGVRTKSNTEALKGTGT